MRKGSLSVSYLLLLRLCAERKIRLIFVKIEFCWNFKIYMFDVSQTFKCYNLTQGTWENGKKVPICWFWKIHVFLGHPTNDILYIRCIKAFPTLISIWTLTGGAVFTELFPIPLFLGSLGLISSSGRNPCFSPRALLYILVRSLLEPNSR